MRPPSFVPAAAATLAEGVAGHDSGHDGRHPMILGLERRLAPGDRRKLDEYFTSVRDIEQRIERAA
ncbi:MAG: DUF1552 domain-containing protein, partial [Planctomycetia bacterium]